MRKLLLAVLFFVGCHTGFAQKWLWVKPQVNANTNSNTVPWAMATDTAGNAIVTGGYNGTVTVGPYTLASGFGNPWAAFILIKYDSAGNVLWAKTSTTTPSKGWCFGYSVAIDKMGNSYASGSFFDTIRFGSQTVISSTYSIFLVKYDANGNVVWIRTGMNSTSQGMDIANSVAIDNAGNPYITGTFYDTINFGTTSLYNGTIQGNAYIAKYSPNGNLLWAATPTCASCAIAGTGLAADNSGNIYATGNYNTPSTINFGSTALANGKSRNMFLVKYDAGGNVLWATNAQVPSKFAWVSKAPQLGEQLTTDKLGNVTITGNYLDTVIIGGQLLTCSFNNYNNAIYSGNIFIAKYSPAGNPLWQKTMLLNTDSSSAVNYGIVTDRWDNMYLTGSFIGGITLGGIKLQAPAGGQPAFIIKIDSIGEALCGTALDNQYVGNSNVGVSGNNGIAADPKGPNVYITSEVAGYSYCAFGKDTIHSIGQNNGFAAKWTCGTCNVPPIITGNTSICTGQTITLTAGGGIYYAWNNGASADSITITPSVSQRYYVTISNDSCAVKDSTTITVHPVPVPIISANQNICRGNNANLSAGGGTIYNWQPAANLTNANSANPTANPNSTTEYTVSISNGFCSVTDSTLVTINPLPVATISNDTAIQPGQSAALTAGGGQTYIWTPTNNLSCDTCPTPTADPLVTTTYSVIISNSYGCSVTKTVTVDVNCGQLFIPEAFSPNGDGVNDVLYVRDDCIKTMQFMIFDRWGNRVFETTNITEGWNGQHNGLPMNTGTYTYYLSATDYSGNIITKKGNVELVR